MNKTEVLNALRLGLQKQEEDAVRRLKQELRAIDLVASLMLVLGDGLAGFTLKRFPAAEKVEIELVKTALLEASLDPSWFVIWTTDTYIAVSLTRDMVKDIVSSDKQRIMNNPDKLVRYFKKAD